MSRFTSTGAHRQRIIDVHPNKGIKLPPDDHFHSFFSKFGSILEVYHYPSKKPSGVDHTYVVFEGDDAIPKFKQYKGSKTTSDYWKDSCKTITGIPNAPRELMDRINSQTAGSSSSKSVLASFSREDEESSNVPDAEEAEASEEESAPKHVKSSKRKREEQTVDHTHSKKKRPAEESESGEQGSSTDSLPANAPEDESEPPDESHVKNMKKEPRTPRLSPTPPALEFAKQALILAARARKRSFQTQAANDVISELERLKAERDEARAERDTMRVERDEALEQRDAAIESSRESQRELQVLKNSIEERDERTDEILGLVTASLHSLQRKSRRAGE